MTSGRRLTSRPLGSRLRVGRPVLRAQLALLYSGLFLGLLAVALLAANLVVARGAAQAPSGPGPLPGLGSPADATRDFAVASAVGGLVVAVVVLAGAWWLAGRFLRPVRAMTAAAQEISASNLHRRLALKGPKDELTELGRTLDDLFGRLDASFESQRHFVANASHELRTPLAGQRALLQVALADPDATADELRVACREALQLGAQQEQLIAALLTLASSEAGVDRWEALDLAPIAERVLAERREEAEQRGLQVTAGLSPAPAAGDPTLVERLVANLVDNALRHNLPADPNLPAGHHGPLGTVEVSTSSAPGRATLTVRNTGPAVPGDQIDRLRRAFQRGDGQRLRSGDGYGLGLAIVDAVARAHGAELAVEPRLGGGLDVTVTFAASRVGLQAPPPAAS